MGDQTRIEMRFDEKTQIIYQRLEGPLDEEDSQKMYNQVLEFKKKMLDPGKVRIIAFSDNAEKPTSAARRKLLELEKLDDFYKMGVIGKNPYMKTVLNFFLMVSGSKKIRTFSTEEEALKWVRE